MDWIVKTTVLAGRKKFLFYQNIIDTVLLW